MSPMGRTFGELDYNFLRDHENGSGAVREAVESNLTGFEFETRI